MESELWSMIIAALNRIKVSEAKRCKLGDLDIVWTYLWAVLHRRPIFWACQKKHWPLWAWRWDLPSPSTMTRRLSTPEVQAALAALESSVLGQPGPTMWHALDGQALAVQPHCQDRDATFRRGTGGVEQGYKLHLIYGQNGSIPAWTVEPIHVVERVAARRLVQRRSLKDMSWPMRIMMTRNSTIG